MLKWFQQDPIMRGSAIAFAVITVVLVAGLVGGRI